MTDRQFAQAVRLDAKGSTCAEIQANAIKAARSYFNGLSEADLELRCRPFVAQPLILETGGAVSMWEATVEVYAPRSPQ